MSKEFNFIRQTISAFPCCCWPLLFLVLAGGVQIKILKKASRTRERTELTLTKGISSFRNRSGLETGLMCNMVKEGRVFLCERKGLRLRLRVCGNIHFPRWEKSNEVSLYEGRKKPLWRQGGL